MDLDEAMDVGEDEAPKITLGRPEDMLSLPMGILAGESMSSGEPMETAMESAEQGDSGEQITLNIGAGEFGISQDPAPQIQLQEGVSDPPQADDTPAFDMQENAAQIQLQEAADDPAQVQLEPVQSSDAAAEGQTGVSLIAMAFNEQQFIQTDQIFDQAQENQAEAVQTEAANDDGESKEEAVTENTAESTVEDVEEENVPSSIAEDGQNTAEKSEMEPDQAAVEADSNDATGSEQAQTKESAENTKDADADAEASEEAKTQKPKRGGRIIGNIMSINQPADWTPNIEAVESNAAFESSSQETSQEEVSDLIDKTKECKVSMVKCKPCLTCNRAFMEEHEYIDHECVPIDDPENKTQAKQSKSSRRSSNEKEESEATNFPCGHCSKSFKTNDMLIQHKKKEHAKVYPCKKCDAKFDQESLLQRHIYRAHEKQKDSKDEKETPKPAARRPGRPRKDAAPPASSAAKIKSPVFARIKSVKPAAKEAIPMQVVVGGKVKMFGKEGKEGKKAETPEPLGQKRGAARLQCKRCGAIFKSIMDLAEHRKEATCTQKEDMDGMRECEECGKEFNNIRSLEKHLLVCKGSDNEDEEFWCDLCDKGFTTKNQLNAHNSVKHKRSGGKSISDDHKCHLCQKSFSTSSRLATHLAIKHRNMGVEPDEEDPENPKKTPGRPSKTEIRCEACKKVFSKKDDLLKHVLQTGHTGEKHLIKVTVTPKQKKQEADEDELESEDEPLADMMSDDDEEWVPEGGFKTPKAMPREPSKLDASPGVNVAEGRLYCSCGCNYSRNHDFVTHMAKMKHKPAPFQTKDDQGVWKHVKEPPEEYLARKPGSRPLMKLPDSDDTQQEYVCYFCQKGFTGKAQLRGHLAVKHKVFKKVDDPELLPQPKKKPVETPKSADEIAMESGEDEEGYSCKVCDEMFSNEEGLLRHEFESGHSQTIQQDPASKSPKKAPSEHATADKPEPEFICRECNKIFPDAATLKLHCISHPTFMCRKCGKTYDTKQALLEHEKKLHAKKVPVEKPTPEKDQEGVKKEIKVEVKSAQKGKTTPKKTYTPKPKVASKGPAKCDVCERPFLNMHALRIHQEKAHGLQTMSKMHACNECHMRFNQAHQLRAHIILKHQGQKDYKELIKADKPTEVKCDSCGAIFTNERNLKTHLSLKHGGKNHAQYKTLSDYECHICHKKMDKRAHLYKHVTVVHKIPFGRLKYFECDICDEAFSEQAKLDAHIAQHNERKFQCPHCPLKFYRERGLELHMNKHKDLPPKPIVTLQGSNPAVLPKNLAAGNDMDDDAPLDSSDSFDKYFNAEPAKPQVESPYSCDDCGKVFIAQVYLDKHKHSHAKAHRCEVCYESFNTLKQLEFHRSTRHPIVHRKLLCPHPKCPRFFYKQLQLDRHRRKVHGRFPCRFCGQRFDQVAPLNEHIREHSGEKPYLCDVCNENFVTLESLKGHYLTKHHDDKKGGKRCLGSYPCESCGKIFTSRASKDFHVRKAHFGEKPFECKTCLQTFFNSYTLQYHRRTSHPEEYPQKDESGKTIRLKCNYCVQTFKSQFSLKHHEYTHTGQKPYRCVACGKGFRLPRLLRQHEMMHSGEAQHVCKTCGKAFMLMARLRKHELIHTGEHPTFECEVCTKVFGSKAALKAHLVVHSDQRPFLCGTCGKTFRTKRQLLVHEQKHEELAEGGERVRLCHLCGASFKYQSTFARHNRMHEQGLSVDEIRKREAESRKRMESLAKERKSKILVMPKEEGWKPRTPMFKQMQGASTPGKVVVVLPPKGSSAGAQAIAEKSHLYTTLRTQADGSTVLVMNDKDGNESATTDNQTLIDNTQFTSDALASEFVGAGENNLQAGDQLLDASTQGTEALQYSLDTAAASTSGILQQDIQYTMASNGGVKQEGAGAGEAPAKKRPVYLINTAAGLVMVEDPKVLAQMGIQIPKSEEQQTEQQAQDGIDTMNTDFQQTYDPNAVVDNSNIVTSESLQTGFTGDQFQQQQGEETYSQYVLQNPGTSEQDGAGVETMTSAAVSGSESFMMDTTANSTGVDSVPMTTQDNTQDTTSNWLSTLADAATSTPKAETKTPSSSSATTTTPQSIATTSGSLATSSTSTPATTKPSPAGSGKKTKYIISYGGKKYVCYVDANKSGDSSTPVSQNEGLKSLLKGALAKTLPSKTTPPKAVVKPAQTATTTATTPTPKKHATLFSSPFTGVKTTEKKTGLVGVDQTLDTPIMPGTVATPKITASSVSAVSSLSTPTASTMKTSTSSLGADKSKSKYIIVKKDDKFLLIPQSAAKNLKTKSTPATKDTLESLKSSLTSTPKSSLVLKTPRSGTTSRSILTAARSTASSLVTTSSKASVITPKSSRGVKLTTGGSTGLGTLVVPSLKVESSKSGGQSIILPSQSQGTKRKYVSLLSNSASSKPPPAKKSLLLSSALSSAASASTSTSGATSSKVMYLITDRETGKQTLSYTPPAGVEISQNTPATETQPDALNTVGGGADIYMSDSERESQAALDLQRQNLAASQVTTTLFPPGSDVTNQTTTTTFTDSHGTTYIMDSQGATYATAGTSQADGSGSVGDSTTQYITTSEGMDTGEAATSQGTDFYSTTTSQAGTAIQYVTDTGETVTSGGNYITQYVTETGEILDPSQFEGYSGQQQYSDPNTVGAGQILQYTDPNTGEIFQQYTDPNTGELMEHRVSDPSMQQMTDPSTGEVLQQQMTDPNTGEVLQQQMTDPNTEEVLQQQMTDPNTGEVLQQQMTDPNTEEVLQQQMTDPNTEALQQDQGTGEDIAKSEPMDTQDTGEQAQQYDPNTAETEQYTEMPTEESEVKQEQEYANNETETEVKTEMKQEGTEEFINQESTTDTGLTSEGATQQYFTDQDGNQFLITTGGEGQAQQEGIQYQFVDDQGQTVQYVYGDGTQAETSGADSATTSADPTVATSGGLGDGSNIQMFVQDGITYYYQADQTGESGETYATTADGQQFILQHGTGESNVPAQEEQQEPPQEAEESAIGEPTNHDDENVMLNDGEEGRPVASHVPTDDSTHSAVCLQDYEGQGTATDGTEQLSTQDSTSIQQQMYTDGLFDHDDDDDEEDWETEWKKFQAQKERSNGYDNESIEPIGDNQKGCDYHGYTESIESKLIADLAKDTVDGELHVLYVDGTSDMEIANASDSADENLNVSKSADELLLLLECELCGLRFSNKSTLDKHKNNEDPFYCRVELKIPLPERNRKGTRMTESESPYVCNECERTFTTYSAVKKHIQAQHIGSSLEACELCTESFRRRSEYDDHLECHFTFWLTARKSEVLLNQTQKRAKTKEQESHVEKLPISKGRMCEICGIGFTDTLEYEDHMDIEHAELSLLQEGGQALIGEEIVAEELEPGEIKVDCKYFPCEFCQAGFEDVTAFINHMSGHSAEVELKEKLQREQEQEELELLRRKEAMKKEKAKEVKEERVARIKLEEEDEDEDEEESEIYEEDLEEINSEEEEEEEEVSEDVETIVMEVEDPLSQDDEMLKQCMEKMVAEQAEKIAIDDEPIENQEQGEMDQEDQSESRATKRDSDDCDGDDGHNETESKRKSQRPKKSGYKFPNVSKKTPVSDFVFTCEICSQSFQSMVKVRKHINEVHIKSLKVKEEKMDTEDDSSQDTGTVLEQYEEYTEEDMDPDFNPDGEEDSDDDTKAKSTRIKKEKLDKDNISGRRIPKKMSVNTPVDPVSVISVNGEVRYSCGFCERVFRNMRSAKRHVTSLHVRNIAAGVQKNEGGVEEGVVVVRDVAATIGAVNEEEGVAIASALEAIQVMEMEKMEKTQTEEEEEPAENDKENEGAKPKYLEGVDDQNAVECKDCNRVFNDRFSLQMHMISCHAEKDNEEDINCMICNKSFKTTRQLRIHVTLKHKEEEEEEKKEEEEAENAQESQEEEEKDSVDEEEATEPPTKRQRKTTVNEDYDYTPAFKKTGRGRKKKNVVGSGETFKCDMCEKQFKSRANLRIHQTMVHVGRNLIFKNETVSTRFNTHPEVCTECRSRFQTREELDEHMENPTCPLCQKSFSSCQLYKHHKKTHTKKEWNKLKAVTCELCGMTFSKTGGLRLHRLIHNICNYCDLKCDTADELTVHLKTMHANLVNTICPHCGLRFTKKWNMDIHIAKYHSKARGEKMEIHVAKDGRRRGRYKMDCTCDFCGKVFAKPYEMKRHRTKHTGEKPCKCDVCGESFATPSARAIHRNKVHLAKTYPCKICGAEFKYTMARNRHMESHTELEKKFTCEKCGMQFLFKATYSAHVKNQKCTSMEYAATELKYSCQDCDQTFQYDHTLINHRIKAHEDREPYWCEVPGCSQRFPSAPDLIFHRKSHPGLEVYHCSACAIEFSSASSLQFHQRQYHRTRVHRSCTICGHVCRGEAAYEEHQRIVHHSGDRVQCACELCGKAFAYRSALERHKRIKHNPEKPFRCKVCQRKFKTDAELYAHKMERHPPGQAFSCTFCPSSYNYLATLVRHMKDMHGVVHGGIQVAKEEAMDNTAQKKRPEITPMHVESGERIYKCKLCYAAYHHIATMNRHMREKHSPMVPGLKDVDALSALKKSIKVIGPRNQAQEADPGQLQIVDSDDYEPTEEQIAGGDLTEMVMVQDGQEIHQIHQLQNQSEQFVLSIPEEEEEGVRYVSEGVEYVKQKENAQNVQVIQDENGAIQIIDGARHGLEVLQQGVEYVTAGTIVEGGVESEGTVQYITETDPQETQYQNEIQYVDENGQPVQYVVDTGEQQGHIVESEGQEYIMVDNGNGEMMYVLAQSNEIAVKAE